MLSRKAFDYQMEFLRGQFRDTYTEVRKNMLYESISFLKDEQLMTLTYFILERYNKNYLPPITQVVMIAKQFEFGNKWGKAS